jgi:hypothetical protein
MAKQKHMSGQLRDGGYKCGTGVWWRDLMRGTPLSYLKILLVIDAVSFF